MIDLEHKFYDNLINENWEKWLTKAMDDFYWTVPRHQKSILFLFNRFYDLSFDLYAKFYSKLYDSNFHSSNRHSRKMSDFANVLRDFKNFSMLYFTSIKCYRLLEPVAIPFLVSSNVKGQCEPVVTASWASILLSSSIFIIITCLNRP